MAGKDRPAEGREFSRSRSALLYSHSEIATVGHGPARGAHELSCPGEWGRGGVMMINDERPKARPQIEGYVALDTPPAIGRTARVYKAVRLADGATVAIKVLTTSIEQGEFLEEAFRRETQSLAELSHPNILRMHGSGITAAGDRYIVLDWLDSDLVRWKMEQESFEWEPFWRALGLPIASAVAHAHTRNIAHRDLAPRNILVTADGRPMVADFGMAKLRRFMRTERTLREFVSPPFTPLETDDGSGTLARDVFSLATLFCWCASPVDLESYASVYAFAETSDVFPAPVRDLLLQSLSDDPDERPKLAEEFLERAKAGTVARRPTASSLSCLLALGHAQSARISREFGLTGRAPTEMAILDDLSAVCAIEPRVDGEGQVGAFGDLWLYGLTRAYHARPDETHGDRLVILSAMSRPSGWLEAQRERAITPKIDFRFASRGREADQRALAQVQQIVDEFLHERAEAEADPENRLLDTWTRILQAKQELEFGRERPIRYHGHRVDGRRVRFRTIGAVPDGAALEKRQVKLQDGTFLTGHIEEFEGNEAVFLVAGGDVELLRGDGEISVNVYAASEALRKQQRALDAFRQREVARSHMADVLLNPELAAAIAPIRPARWFQGDLDDDKREAVAAALGSPDLLLLRGPPGTGKTTFIAELIMQELDRDPGARILLASQTHVAIDNAVERVAELRAEAGLAFEIVRIGANDERISDGVEPQRLHRRLQAWTDEVSRRVAEYAESRAAEHGVERRTVLIGMALDQLVACERDAAFTSSAVSRIEDELERLPDKGRRDAKSSLDLDVAGSIAARRLELEQLRERRRAAETEANRLRDELVRLDEADFSSLRGAELESAAELYLEQSEAARELRPLIDLGAEWTARFGRQDHFEGPFLSTVQVVAGTCLGVVGPKSVNEMRFDLCIVDEASKATATEMLVPLARGARWVLVGDSNQLPPFQDEAMRNDKFLQQHDLRREEVAESLFGYLERTLPKGNVFSLKSQRRMVQAINDLIQACFYPDQELICRRTKPKHRFPPVLKQPVTWIDTSRSANRRETVPESGIGRFNKYECEIVNRLLKKLNKHFAKRDPERKTARITVAVITGYMEQVRMLERTMRPRSPGWTHLDIALNTVDAFQGRQADMVVYSVARSNPFKHLGFLDQPPRLNVALSRGKDALVVVGDREFCMAITGENPFREVIRWISKADGCAVEHSE